MSAKSSESQAEPLRMHSIVVDSQGDQWVRGRVWWKCLAKVDGERVRNVGRLHWSDLVRMYGPIRVLREGKRASTGGVSNV